MPTSGAAGADFVKTAGSRRRRHARGPRLIVRTRLPTSASGAGGVHASTRARGHGAGDDPHRATATKAIIADFRARKAGAHRPRRRCGAADPGRTDGGARATRSSPGWGEARASLAGSHDRGSEDRQTGCADAIAADGLLTCSARDTSASGRGEFPRYGLFPVQPDRRSCR